MGALETTAKEFVDRLLDELDVGGSNYSPDLRDSLTDNRKWLEEMIADLLESRDAGWR